MKRALSALCCFFVAGAALAEAPVELPPMSSGLTTYTDERGCVFQRKRVGGWWIWVQTSRFDSAGGCTDMTRDSEPEAPQDLA